MKWNELTCLWSGKQDAIFSCCWCIRCLWRQICVCVLCVCVCVCACYVEEFPCTSYMLCVFCAHFLVFISCLQLSLKSLLFLLFLPLFLVPSSPPLVNFQIQTAHDLHLKRKKKRKNEGSWIFIFVGWCWALLRGSLLTHLLLLSLHSITYLHLLVLCHNLLVVRFTKRLNTINLN